MEGTMENEDEVRELAISLFQSWRGQYVVSQALVLAIKAINARPPEEQEPSNVADMECLLELFPIYRDLDVAAGALKAFTGS
jgi:hypothetical protein